MPKTIDLNIYRAALLGWYDQNQRDLPWRRRRDGYGIWLSEIMLQQTTVATVIPYYERFLKTFPDLKAVAEAPEEQLLKAWAGLGYYNRVRQFQKAAKEIYQDLGGIIPKNKEALMDLPGLGDYTAAAVASIAFGEPVAVVDGNVMRVLARLYSYREDIGGGVAKAFFRERAQALLESKRSGDFNQAMMELGATVCTPRGPMCLLCPVSAHCAAFQSGNPENYPVKLKKIEYRQEDWMGFIIATSRQLLLRQRAAGEIMAGLWEIPMLQPTTAQKPDDLLRTFIPPSQPMVLTPIKSVQHTIMNRRMRISPYLATVPLRNKWNLPPSYEWVDLKSISDRPITTITRKILRQWEAKASLSSSRS